MVIENLLDKLAQDKGHLSNSQIGSMLKCPAQYEFSYIKGIKMPPPGAMIQGSAYHKGVETGYKFKKNKLENPSEKFVQEAADEGWAERLKAEPEIEWKGSDPGGLKDQVMDIVAKYAREIIPTITPLDVEQWETLNINGINFVRVRDLVTATGVIDHKLAARKYDPSKKYNDLQSLAYLYPNGGKFEYHVATKTLKKEIQIADYSRTKAEVDWWVILVGKVYAQIKSGNFPPNPTGFFCSPEWCGYWKLCRERR